MTLGRLAASTLSAGTNTLIYTVPSASSGISATINVANRGTEDAEVSLAFVDGTLTALADEDWIEKNVTLRAGGVIERSGITMYRGASIIAYASKSDVNVQVWG